MKTVVMERTTSISNSSSSSSSSQDNNMSSKRHFHWTTNNKVGNEEQQQQEQGFEEAFPQTMFKIIQDETTKTTKKEEEEEEKTEKPVPATTTAAAAASRKKLQAVAISKLRSVLTVFGKNRSFTSGLGPRVVGTLFGYRRGHVHFAFQKDPTSQPAFLIELATPISNLVREMASGLVRIALECDRAKTEDNSKKQSNHQKQSNSGKRLLQEPLWRTYCNGKKCGYANRRECGEKDWEILKAVEPISMGAGVLPAAGSENGGSGSDGGEVMYMRARFERVVGSRDSEAFYMMNPDSNGAPELSIYLLRV